MQTTANCIKRRVSVLRGLVAVGVALVCFRWLVGVAGSTVRLVATGAPARADEVLVGLAAGAAALCLLWLAVAVGLGLGALVPGVVGEAASAAGTALTPRLMRRVVGMALGVGVAAGLAPSASVATPRPVPSVLAAPRPASSSVAPVSPVPSSVVAAPRPVPEPGVAPLPDPGWRAPGTPAPDAGARPEAGARPAGTAMTRSAGGASASPSPNPGWLPKPPVIRPQPDVRVLSPTPRPTSRREAGEVVVRRGDTLWSIAARHLGPDPSDAEIAQAWPAWHDANRAVVGQDPDVLLPGQVLRPPRAVVS